MQEQTNLPTTSPDLQSKALVVQTTAQLVTLTEAQKALLKMIRACVENKESLTMNKIVDIYYNNVRKNYYRDYGWDLETKRYTHREKLDIMVEFNKNSAHWTYGIRANVRQWFVANIGILVIKNQLIVIPVIDVGNEETKTEPGIS